MHIPMSPSLFGRLALVRDLSARAATLLSGTPNSFDATQGVVLLDQSIEMAMGVVIAETGRQRAGDRFRDLLDQIPELPNRSDLEILHMVRNAAQHRGVPPPADKCSWARRVGLEALRALFPLLGGDYETLSSVAQLGMSYLRDPLDLALARITDRPSDAAALAARAMTRLRGWVAHLTGNALVPDEMWVFQAGLWNDTVIMASCADNRQEFLYAMLSLAAGGAMGIAPPTLLRFSRLAHGHNASAHSGRAFEFQHAEGAVQPTPEDAAWMIELVARCALRFETEWPDLVLVEDGESR